MQLIRRLLAGAAVALSLGATMAPAVAETVFRAANIVAWSAQNFNPFSGSFLPLTTAGIYETLFYVNQLNNNVVPVLGTEYKWSDDYLQLTVSVREGALWHDGQPFTADDVVFTYQELKKFPALDLTALWQSGLTDVSASDGKVVFTFAEPNTPIFTDLTNVAIIPRHIWESIEEPAAFANENPVGTGPFTFAGYSMDAIRGKRFADYWMKDAPKFDVYEIVPTQGNDPALLLTLRNQVYWFGGGITDPKGYAARGENYKYWWPTTSFNFLDFNTTKPPFDDPAFRRAIGASLDVDDIASKAYNGAVNGASRTAVIPEQLKVWPLEPDTLSAAVPFDPALADKMLTDAGYKLDAEGHRLGLDGKPLPTFGLLTGTGWGDYLTICQLVSQSLAKLGISTTIDQQAYATYMGAVRSASYDMVVTWGWGLGSTPYDLFYKSFSPKFSAGPGENVTSNITRYTHPAVTDALDTFRKTADFEVQKAAINTMVKQVMQDMPWVPLTERPSFIQYNTIAFTGFPDASNPYNNGGQANGPAIRVMLLNLQPK